MLAFDHGLLCLPQQRPFDQLPPRERIAADTYWRVAHGFNTSLPGWLILVPRRHVTTIAELTRKEAAALGTWQVRLSRVLHEVTGCAKTYVIQFAEQESFATFTSTSCRACSTSPTTTEAPRSSAT